MRSFASCYSKLLYAVLQLNVLILDFLLLSDISVVVDLSQKCYVGL